jgi:hypothetical protein
MARTLERDQNLMYTLFEDGSGQVVLNVVVGGFAMYEVSLPLNDEELRRYHDEGKIFIDKLASVISRNDQAKYAGRLRPPS